MSPACIRDLIAPRRKAFLARTTIKRTSKVRELSKGMVAQLHLAIVMAIDARLLVLDEPTLGLDILYRKQFYDSLLNDYFDHSRTIIVTTHQVEEVQDVLTDLMFINRGRIVLECSMEEFESRYVEVMVHPDHVAGARALKPIHERQVFGRSVLLFDGVGSRPTRGGWRHRDTEHRRFVRRGDEQYPQPTSARTPRVSSSRSKMNTESNNTPVYRINDRTILRPAAVLVGAARSCGRTVRSTLRH